MEHYLRKELYELIKEDESIFDFIQEGSLDGLWYWDLENPENEWMNPRFWEVLGYDPEDMPHKASAWQDIINPDDLKIALDNFHKHVADPNHPYDQEVRYTHKNGSTVWVRCRGLVIRNKDDKPVRMVGAHQDITNLKNAEEQLRQEHEQLKKNEELYRFITENTIDVIRYQSPSGEFSYVSPNIEELSGYTADEYLKFDSLENVVPEDHELLKQVVEKFKQDEDNVRVEYRLFHKNGSAIWVESRIKAIRNENGEVISLLSSTNDITQKKATEQKLKLSNTRYKQLVETAVDAIYLIDENGIVIDTNHQATLMLEKSRDEIIGQNVEVIDPNFPVDAFLAFWAPIPYDETRIFETTHIDKAGRIVPIEISGKKYKLDGKTYYYGIARDISERKNAEKEIRHQRDMFESVINSVPARIFWKDKEGTYLGCNPNFVIDSGAKSVKEVIGQKDEALTWGKDAELYRKDDREVIKSGKAKLHYEEPFIGKDGDEIIWRTNKMPLKNNLGETVGVIATSVNITDEKKAEAELKQKQYHLENAQELGKIGSWDLDIAKNELLWTDENYRIFGIPIGTPMTYDLFLKHIHPDDREYVDSKWNAAMRGEEAYDINHRLLMDDGEVKWVREKAHLIFDDNGKCVRGTGFTQDITEAKLSEQKLQNSEKRLKEAQKMASMGYYEYNIETEEQWWSEELYHILEFDANKPSPTIEEFSKRLDQEDIDNLNRLLQHVISTGENDSLIYKIHMPSSGKYKYISTKAEFYTDEFNTKYVKGTLQDVTERIHAEKALKESEAAVRRKLTAIAEPDGDLGTLTLSDIMDAETLQPLIENLARITGMCTGITDLEGNILASAGWTDACSLFHRKCPEAEKNCIESDTVLAKGVAAGDYKLYKCKNHLWEWASPITIAGQHMGNIYLGQFLYDDEDVDANVYKEQAHKFGFNEKEYLDAIKLVPRFSRKKVVSAIQFFAEFAEMISKQSFNNIKLSRLLSQVKLTEQELKHSEARLAASQQMAKLGNFEHDFEKDTIWWSDELYALLGYDKTELPPNFETFLKRLPEEDAQTHKELVERAAKFGKGYSETFCYQIPGMEMKHLFVKAEVIFDSNNNPVGLKGTTQDVTERVKGAQALKESEEKYRNLVENLDEMIFRYELQPEPKFTYVSPNSTKLVGYTPQEHYDDPYLGAKIIHPDDTPVMDKYMKEGLQKGESVVFRWVKKDGEILWTEQRNKPIYNKAGEIIALEGIARDITEKVIAENKLQESEEKFRNLYEKSPFGIVICQMIRNEENEFVDFLHVQLNESVNEQTGFDIEQLAGKKASEIVDTRTLKDLVRLYGEVISDSKTINYEQYFEVYKRTLEVTAFPLIKDYFIINFINISERKEAEEKIKQSEERYRLIFETAANLITSVNKDGIIVDCNQRITEILGYPKEEIVRNPMTKIMHPDYYEKAFKSLNTIIKQGYNYNQVYKMVRKDGNIIDVSINASAIKTNGVFERTICIIEDITERLQTEEKIKLRELHLSSLVENPVGYIIYRTRFNRKTGQIEVVQVSPSCTDILSISEEDRENFQQWFQYIHPEDLPKLMEASNAGMSPPFKLNIEVRYNHPAKGLKWLEIRANGIPYGDDPNMIEYANGIILDITEQKHAEEKIKASEAKFRGVFEESNVGIALGSAEGTVVEVNEEYLNITGYTREEFINLNYAEITHPDDLAKETPLFEQLHKGEIEHYRIEKRLLMKNGEYRWLDAAVSCRRNTDGDVDLTIALVIDIHEGKRANETVNTFFDQPMNIHLIGTIEGEITKINEGWIQTLGYTKEETLGKNIMDFIHPDDVESTVNELKDLESGKTTFYFENRYKHKNGNYINLAWSAIFNTSGKLLHGVAKDITQQKAYHEQLIKSEDKYKALSENAKHIIFTHTIGGEITYVNQFGIEFLKLPKDQIIGLKIEDLITDEQEKIKMRERVKGFLQSSTNIHQYELEIKLPDGKEHTLEIIGSQINPTDGNSQILITAYDITERKKSEILIQQQNEEYEAINEELTQTNEALHFAMEKTEESHDRFDKAMEATSDGLWDWNLITNDIYYSPRWKAILGYKEDELPNDFSVWEKLTDPEDVKRSWKMLNALIEGKEQKFDIEFKMKHKKGHWVDIHSRANVFKNEEGKAIRVVGTHTDITLKKKAEDEIRQLNTRFALATDSAKIGVWDLDLVNNHLSWDNRMFQLYGLEKAAFGGAYETWKNGVHPDDILKADEEVQQAIRGEKQFDTEFRVVWPNKEIRYLKAYAQVIFDASGKAIRMIGVNYDITESKQAEEKIRESEENLKLSDSRFRKAEELGKIGNWEYNIQTEEFWGSDQSKQIYELDPQNSFTPEEVESCITERESVHQSLIDLIEQEKPYDLEFDIITKKSGKRKTITSLAKLIRDQEGKPFKVLGVIQDITERKLTEEELNKHRLHLEELVKDRTLELEEKNADLERFNKLFVGRELRIKELRDELKELRNKLKNIEDE